MQRPWGPSAMTRSYRLLLRTGRRHRANLTDGDGPPHTKTLCADYWQSHAHESFEA
jgi:hypothetical protein